MKDWPYEAHPTGWYQIGYSEEFARGDVRPVRYFGEDLVLFRNDDGDVGLLDAYCAHLGAHLGHGGEVDGACLQCPWHGWQWNSDGTNHSIPYGDRETTKATVKPWEVREIDGIVLTWYDALGRPSFWEWPGLPELRDHGKFYPVYPHCTKRAGERAVKPQSPLENIPDYEHFQYVHGAGEAATPLTWEPDGHYLNASSEMRFGVGFESTWLTPDGPITGHIESEAWGLGLGLARLTLREHVAAHLICVTPIDDELSELYSTVATNREADDPGDEPTGFAAKLIDAQHKQIENDFHIWENQRFVQRPAFTGLEEVAYGKFRSWTEQFYPDVSGNGSSAEGAGEAEPAAR